MEKSEPVRDVGITVSAGCTMFRKQYYSETGRECNRAADGCSLRLQYIQIIHVTPSLYAALATAVLSLNALFILWVVFGALLTRSRPILRWLHIISLVWGILTELLPWPCPLTLLENWLEQKAGVEPYQGGFLLHYMDKLVYPNISATVLVLTVAGVFVCVFNLALYGRLMWMARTR